MQLNDMSWDIIRGAGPIVVAAIHAGHSLGPQARASCALDDATRLREEDPHTDKFVAHAQNRIVVHTSRFEVDLNRPLHKAVYLSPEDAWGLTVWRGAPPASLVDGSRSQWMHFYADVGVLLDELIERYGRVVVLDMHSYCHRRGGPDAPFDDPRLNPDINIGTAGAALSGWRSLIDRFSDDLRAFDEPGRALDVRENVKFTGGHFARWINARYRGNACALAVELKKTFMDEWTGVVDVEALGFLERAFCSALEGLNQQLEAMGAMDDALRMSTAKDTNEDHVEA